MVLFFSYIFSVGPLMEIFLLTPLTASLNSELAGSYKKSLIVIIILSTPY